MWLRDGHNHITTSGGSLPSICERLVAVDADRRDFLADENEHDRERHLLVDRERLVKYYHDLICGARERTPCALQKPLQ